MGSPCTHRANTRFLAASIAGTLLIYTARYVAAGEHDQHLRWRCPVPSLSVSAAVFAGGQLSGAVAIVFKAPPFTLRRHDEPPASSPLKVFLVVSVTSTVMLAFMLMWAAGLPAPRCLSGSPMCLRLRENLEQKGWITVALFSLMCCQLLGSVVAGRWVCCGSGAAKSVEVTAIDPGGPPPT